MPYCRGSVLCLSVFLLAGSLPAIASANLVKRPKAAPVKVAPVKAAVMKAAGRTERGRLPSFSAEREAAALTFVRACHPELAKLLGQLKGIQPVEYERAVRELFQTSESLTQLKDRDPKRYEFELEAWQLQSRIELLAARMTQASNKSLEKELRGLLDKQVQLEIKRRKSDRERLQSQLQKTESAISELEKRREQAVENRFRKLVQAHGKSREKSEPVAAPASKKGRSSNESPASQSKR